jgi:hypothetical protein
MRSAIHAQRPADAAWNAAIEGKARDAGVGSGARDLDVRDCRARPEARALLDLDLAEALAEADDHALDAAVAHEKVRAEPNHGDGDVRRRLTQKISEVFLVGRGIEHSRGSAHPEPGEVLKRGIGFQLAAKLGKARDQPVFEIDPAHARPPCSASRFGRAFIQSVMVPAPRPTTRSPDCTTEAIASTRVASSSTVITFAWP